MSQLVSTKNERENKLPYESAVQVCIVRCAAAQVPVNFFFYCVSSQSNAYPSTVGSNLDAGSSQQHWEACAALLGQQLRVGGVKVTLVNVVQ